jgi:hypothetical protein
MKRLTIRVALAGLLLASMAPQSHTFVPFVGGPADESIRPRPALRYAGPTAPWPEAAGGAFIGRYGAGWQVRWDRETGTPRALYGSSIPLLPGGIQDGRALTARLLEFVAEQRGRRGVSSSGLAPVGAERHGRFWYVDFHQTVGSVPVYGGGLQFRLRPDGSLVAISGRIFRGIDPDVTPAVALDRAERLAKGEAGFAEGRDRALDSRLVIYPLDGMEGTRFVLAWMVELVIRDPAGHWFTVVDALDGRVVDRWNQIYYDAAAADSIFGRSRGQILPETPSDPFEQRSFKDLEVRLQGGGSDVTDAAGSYLIVTDGPDSILAALSGPFADVRNDSGPDAGIRREGMPGVPNSLDWDDTNSWPSERNGFYHTVVVHDYMKQIDPGFTGLDYSMPVHVNENQTCNAFWDGFATNFFRSGGGCANTGNIADVIYHEYGHGVTDFQYRPFPQPSGAMHEGFSDYIANSMTDQPLVGRGFFGPGTWIRNSDNQRVYPAPECGGEPHCVGETIAGSLWDMRQNLVASLGQEAGVALADSLFHYARYGHARIFPDYFIDLLLVDDDDGDLSNGIPHADEICDGFENHGLSCVLTPNAPLVLDVGSGSALQVVWQPVPALMAPISRYTLFFGGGSGVYADSIVTSDTTAVVSGLAEGDSVFFALAAEDETGRRSPLSDEGFGVPYSRPQPPTGLSAASGRSDISLTWRPNQELDIDAYMVHRSRMPDSEYTLIAEVAAPDTGYVDGDVEAGVMYFYKVEAKDGDGLAGDPSAPARGRLMSLDGGILLVDGTPDGQDGIPYSWSDETVDAFYAALLADYPVSAEFDLADSAGARFPLDQAILAPYSTVVWHGDSRTAQKIDPFLDEIAAYLSAGGHLFLGGWNLANALSGGDAGVVDFPPGSVPHDFLKLASVEALPSGVQDFEGADPSGGDYPPVSVDPEKSPLFGGRLFNMDVIRAIVDEPVTEPIYAYRSADGDTAQNDGATVGLRYLGTDYRLVLFDFPLFYMGMDDAIGAMRAVMSDLEEAVGIAGDGGGPGAVLPRAFALRQNYPNPFNPSTAIVVEIPDLDGDGSGVRTRLAVFDTRGRRVRVLVDAPRTPGRYVVRWDGRDDRGERVASGVYLYRMEAGTFVSTRKMVMLK